MAAPALQAITNITLSAASPSVAFINIPQNYRDLRIVARTTSTAASGGFMRFNGDAGSNYQSVWMLGNGGGYGSSSQTATGFLLMGMYNGNTNIDTFDILDYSATDKHKTMLNRMNSPQADGAYAVAGRWANNAAVTSIVLNDAAGSFASGSAFTLYGIVG